MSTAHKHSHMLPGLMDQTDGRTNKWAGGGHEIVDETSETQKAQSSVA